MKYPIEGLELNLSRLECDICAVVKLKTQPPGVLQQVTLSPGKVSASGSLIRLGETPGDEALCWIEPHNVIVVEILGTVLPFHVEGDKVTKVEVTPIPRQELEAA